MVHPYMQYNIPLPDEEIPKFEFTLKTCTLFQGVPYGLAQIQFTHPDPQL